MNKRNDILALKVGEGWVERMSEMAFFWMVCLLDLSHVDSQMLTSPFLQLDIDTEVSLYNGNKSLSLDGFNLSFLEDFDTF